MKTIHQKRKRGDTLMGYFKNQPVSDPVSMLAAEIVIYAVSDWRDLIKKKAWDAESWKGRVNFDELRRFFKSQYCEFLLMNFSIHPSRILDQLEKELAEAKLRAEEEHRKKMRGAKNG